MCYNCKKIGHFSKDCRQHKQGNAPHVLPIGVNQHRDPALRISCVNYTIVDGIPTGEEVLVDMFFLNARPIIILFDFGASHDFMSFTTAKKARLTLVASGAPYVISTLGSRVDANRIAKKVPLDLSGRVFETGLIFLSGQEIDFIQGMSWMKWHKVVLDISVRLMHLNSPMYGKVTLHLPMISRIKASYIMWLRGGWRIFMWFKSFRMFSLMICRECLLREPSSSKLNYSPVQLLSLRVCTK
jgi:hypothetical protein